MNQKIIGLTTIAYFLIFVSLLLGIGLSFVPTSNLTSSSALMTYEAELGGGPLILLVLGLLLYWRAKRR